MHMNRLYERHNSLVLRGIKCSTLREAKKNKGFGLSNSSNVDESHFDRKYGDPANNKVDFFLVLYQNFTRK